MRCHICGAVVKDAKHIAVTSEGDPVVACDDCYNKASIFFEEVKYSGKRTGISDAGPEQEVQR